MNETILHDTTNLLGSDFFERKDVCKIATELLGKYLISKIGNQIVGGIITETEAYAGIHDKASHAYAGRRTARTEVMYQAPGTVYVYLCYGIHSLLNVVSNEVGIPDAILIRAIYPVFGNEIIMTRRTKKGINNSTSCVGPGNVTKALGIDRNQNGIMINTSEIYIGKNDQLIPESFIQTGKRIGVDYAEEDAALPYRFYVNHNDLKKLDLSSH